jgi:hypothetical protein
MASLCCCLLSGCLGGYAYPTVAVTPAMKVADTEEHVYAFRVAVKDESAVIDFPEEHVYVLSEMTVLPTGHVLPQARVGCDFGWYFISPLTYWKHTHQTMQVRLYRPGWQTIEVGSWELLAEPTWTAAADLAAQEQAVDRLVSCGTPSRPPIFQSKNVLAPGSAGREHHDALLFAAAEYERLAENRDTAEETRAHLLDKAAALRKRAAE